MKMHSSSLVDHVHGDAVLQDDALRSAHATGGKSPLPLRYASSRAAVPGTGEKEIINISEHEKDSRNSTHGT